MNITAKVKTNFIKNKFWETKKLRTKKTVFKDLISAYKAPLETLL
jgi:hypothetical protein